MKRPTAVISMLALLAASCSQQEAGEQEAPSDAAAEKVQGDAPIPVMVGGEDQLDACATAAVVSGLDPAGDNFLSVRDGPGTGYAEIGRLTEGQQISVCDGDGQWLGVIYAGEGDLDRCGIHSPVATRLAYSGPCQSGWVSANFVTIVAG